MRTLDPETAKSASVGFRFTRAPRRASQRSAAGPPMRSVVRPSAGRSSSSAIRQRGRRKRVGPSLSRTGAARARRACAAAGASAEAVSRGASTRTGNGIAAPRSKPASVRTTVEAASARLRTRPSRPATITGRSPRRRSSASRCGWSTSRAILASSSSRAPSNTRVGGATSAPKKRTSSRLKPRSGPKPSPWRRASETAAAQSTLTPSESGVTRQLFPPAVKVTGTRRSASVFRSSRVCAWAGSRPPTSIPATLTPSAIFVGEPAKASPRTIPTAPSRPITSTARRACSEAAALPRLRGAALAGALGAAFLLRLVLVWSRATPNYFPDEYLYAALGRSLAGLGVPSVRGHAAHFPALLQPLLTAAAWRAGSLETGYRLVQALGAAAFTLAAVPAYLLARRVGLARGIAVAIAGLALLVPDGLYAGFVLAEPFAYPLVLGAVAAGVAALARPSRRNQLLFLLLAGLAAFARTQFGVLAACFVAGVVIVGLRDRSLRRTLREQRLPLACIGLAAAAAVTLAAVRGLGYYASAGHVHAHPAALSKAIGVNLTVLMYAAGWVLVPGAVLGLALALARPRTRVELALGALTLVTSTALLLEAALWGDTGMVQERYVFYVLPLAAICFGLYASRGWPVRRGHAVLALGLVLLAARLPLSGYSRPGADDHSPLLLAVQRLGMIVGGDATAATVIAAVATVLAFAAAAAAWRPRLGTPVLLALAFLVSAGALAGASDFDRLNSAAAHRRYLPADRSWVDHAGVGSATLVTAYGGRPADAEEQLFWNRSLQRVAVLTGFGLPDL